MNADFNLNPANFLIVSGVLQCFIISAVLFFRKTDSVLSNRLLSLIIFTVCMHLTYLMLLDLNLDNQYPHLLWVPYSYLLGIGPLIYHYTRSLVEPDFNVSRKVLVHFIPLLAELIWQVIQIGVSIRSDVLYYNVPSDFAFTVVIYALSVMSLFFYLKMSLLIIQNREKWLYRNLSNLKGVTLHWLYKSIKYYRIIWMLWIPFATIFLMVFRFQWQYFELVVAIYILMLAITYLTYWIGIEGFRNLDIVSYQASTATKAKSYSNLPQLEVDDYTRKIESLMTNDKLYLDENLDLRTLAKHLSLDPNLVSYILNNRLGKNFYEYTNSFRVEEVQHRIRDIKFQHLTILAIALESGFNSKTSFNRVFKQTTGMTPSEFQRQNREKH